MFKKSAVLLKTMIRANSTFNILKHEKDKKKKAQDDRRYHRYSLYISYDYNQLI